MSLRLRLTILYSALTGGILLLFGILLFFLANFLLINQVDDSLRSTYENVAARTHISTVLNLVNVFVPDLNLTSNVLVQVWNPDGTLGVASRTIAFLTTPLDPVGFKANVVTLNDVYVGPMRVHMRVLTEPMLYGGNRIGIMQLAASIGTIDSTRETLLRILLLTAVLSMLIAGLGSWLLIGRALSPLAAVTDTAQQISKTDDLSRRIPYKGPEHDEVGRLITAFNETLGRLEQLFASQQRFLADVSHELRTPLTVIKGNVDLMRKMGAADEESMIGIEEEADRLTRLVGDLLLETQAETGKLPLYFAPVELDTLLLEVFKEMHVLTHDRIQLKLTEIDQVLVNGDRDRLKQVMINLVSNAIKYTPPGGNVYLSLGLVGDNARLIVRDTGSGIPGEDLPHIFERFYRAEKSRSRSKVGGFGLGLSIAYWIVTNHGGRIEVDSAEGKGTTFCIWLPILNRAASAH